MLWAEVPALTLTGQAVAGETTTNHTIHRLVSNLRGRYSACAPDLPGVAVCPVTYSGDH